jgi:hypothetical protein
MSAMRVTSYPLAGPLNVLVPMTLVAAGMTFAWPHARTQASLIVIAALYGQVPFLPSRRRLLY